MSSNTRFSVALHLMTSLSCVEKGLTSDQLAKSVNTNPVVVRRILAKLAHAGLILAKTGRLGGCRLAKRPDQIRLAEVLDALEESPLFSIHKHPEFKNCPVSCHIKTALTGIFTEVDQAARAQLGKMTLAKIVGKIPAADSVG